MIPYWTKYWTGFFLISFMWWSASVRRPFLRWCTDQDNRFSFSPDRNMKTYWTFHHFTLEKTKITQYIMKLSLCYCNLVSVTILRCFCLHVCSNDLNYLVFVRIRLIRGMRLKKSCLCAGEGKPKGGRVEMKEGIVELNGHYIILAFSKIRKEQYSF